MSHRDVTDPFRGLTGSARRKAAASHRTDILARRMVRAARLVVKACAVRGDWADVLIKRNARVIGKVSA